MIIFPVFFKKDSPLGEKPRPPTNEKLLFQAYFGKSFIASWKPDRKSHFKQKLFREETLAIST